MNYAEIKYCDIANGEGVRTSLFVSGCTHHCKNCFNKIAWDFNYGKEFTESVEDDILKSCEPDYISGVTLLGGEPFEPENQPRLLEFLKKFKEMYPEKNVWCYSGYTYEELTGKKESRCFTEKTVDMLETYFKNGGVHFQLTYVSKEDLIKAKETPENYGNLRVRVTGFSDYFVKLRESIQDDIIERTTHK